MKRDIVWTTRFKKDYKLAMKRHLDIELLDDIIRALARGETLPEKNRDHELSGDWTGHRECHIQPDWLLVYRFKSGFQYKTIQRDIRSILTIFFHYFPDVRLFYKVRNRNQYATGM